MNVADRIAQRISAIRVCGGLVSLLLILGSAVAIAAQSSRNGGPAGQALSRIRCAHRATLFHAFCPCIAGQAKINSPE